MLEESVRAALSEQVAFEFYSAYVYRAIAVALDVLNLTGMAKWMYAQELEEEKHARKIQEYIIDRDSEVLLFPIDAPSISLGKVIPQAAVTAFQAAYEHEKKVTARMDSLYDLAVKVNDKATMIFLEWFISEQVEEEAVLDEILTKLSLMDTGAGVLLMNEQLGERG